MNALQDMISGEFLASILEAIATLLAMVFSLSF